MGHGELYDFIIGNYSSLMILMGGNNIKTLLTIGLHLIGN